MAFNFGSSQFQPQVSAFNGSFQAQQAQQSSIYQDHFGTSTVGPGSLLGSKLTNLPSTPSIPDQLQKIKRSWDPTSPECAFQYYFYNKVAPEQSLLYVKPANHDQTRWDAAIAARPDSSSVPVLAIGFSDLQKRVMSQEQQVVAYRNRMHEINMKLTELITRHDLHSTVRIAELRARHAALSHRTMSLAAKIQVLKSRGYALRPDEEALKRKLEELTHSLEDPAVFGKINEVWARMTMVRDRIKLLSEQLRQTGEQWQNAIDWERDDEQLEKIARILKGQQAGLIYLVDVLQKDIEEVDQIISNLEGKRVREEERTRGKR